MLPAIVLAGGASTRMGTPKALLDDPDGQLFIIRILATLKEAGIQEGVVVTGVHHDVTVEACEARPELASLARCVRNPDPARGQLSSLLVGMDAVAGPHTEGLLVALVDVPMVTAATVKQVVDAWRQRRAPIVRPVVGARHGHPVVFDRKVFGALREAPLDRGAKAVLTSRAALIENVAVDDTGCLLDIDTPDEYARLGRRG